MPSQRESQEEEGSLVQDEMEFEEEEEQEEEEASGT